MQHAEKIVLAKEIGRRVGARFGPSVLYGYASGSVARGDDTDRSDLDLTFVTREELRLPGMSPDGYREFFHQEVKTQIEFRSKHEVLRVLGEVGPYWPFQAADYLESFVIHGEEEVVSATIAESRAFVGALPASSFQRGAGHALMWMHAGLAKVRNACDDDDTPRAVSAAVDVAHQSAAFLALLNQRYYHFADPRIYREAEFFPLRLPDYSTMCSELVLARAKSDLESRSATLWEACLELAGRNGVAIERIDRLEDIGL